MSTAETEAPKEAPMTARVGDEIMITHQELHEPVREGQIREVRNDPGGVVYRVSAHAEAIAYDLGMAEVRVVPLVPSAIRLELLPHDRLPGPRHPEVGEPHAP
jgi:Domain of unknown function (DUF1918)